MLWLEQHPLGQNVVKLIDHEEMNGYQVNKNEEFCCRGGATTDVPGLAAPLTPVMTGGQSPSGIALQRAGVE